MKTFFCGSCGGLVFFENVKCMACGHVLGFSPDLFDLTALEPAESNTWRGLGAANKDKNHFRLCGNGLSHEICNWLVPVAEDHPFCVACRINRTIPDLSVTGNLERWAKMERAKRRLVYSLLSLKLPINGQADANRPALSFDFLADVPGGPKILTGHENGLITLNLAEADDAERELRRVGLHEPYRTLVGHFRHEVGHYYWDQLIANTPRLNRFRELFGDETSDYGAALQSYHGQGAPPDWQNRLISAYASAHPWEDWAETWAHYLHMADTIETAAGFGISLTPQHPSSETMKADPKTAAAPGAGFNQIMENWLPLTYTLNSLNRGMGLPDLYPFVLSPPVIDKLRFIHDTIKDCAKK
jgi:hypothetical protein